MTLTKTKISGSSLLTRCGLFTVLWWILTDGALSSWVVGLPTVVLAILASIYLLPQTPIVLTAVPKFAVFFLVHSLKGGVDVAWRAFHPKNPISPDFIEYQLHLPHELAEVFMANMVSLLPGTLSSGIDHGILKVHVLDCKSDFRAELGLLEENVGRLFRGASNTPGGQSS